ncbi:MAG: hypothetical protein AAGC86_08415, partial [Pseudomonadota bacterium]
MHHVFLRSWRMLVNLRRSIPATLPGRCHQNFTEAPGVRFALHLKKPEKLGIFTSSAHRAAGAANSFVTPAGPC